MSDYVLRPEELQKQQSLSSRQIRRQLPVIENLTDLKKRLRQHRKSFLGTYVSLKKYMREKSGADEDNIEALAKFLTKRTCYFWEFSEPYAEEFSYRFYNLTINCLLNEDLAYECIDDIVQLAECLVRSRTVFVFAAKEMLTEDMFGELFDFTERYDDTYFSPNFEDAVLGAVSVLSGALEDPFVNEERGGAK